MTTTVFMIGWACIVPLMRDDRPSDTAILVARSIMLAAQEDGLRKLVAEGEVKILRRILGEGGGWFGWALRRVLVRRLFFLVMNLMVPGIVAHYLVRKRRIEAAVRKALAAGASRVVVLGAGFDTLAWRLHEEFPGVEFLEIDHPATQAFRDLIDLALSFGGSFFLTYHRWARRDQIERAYPQFGEFLRLKGKHDPEGRFQSEWWRHHRNLFATP